MSERRVKRIGIRELRQNASVYVDMVWTEGVIVEITNRGQLAACLVPAEAPQDPLAELVAAGLVEPAESDQNPLDVVPVPLPAGVTPPSEDIIREREESPW